MTSTVTDGVEALREDTRAIEISFGAPVHLSAEHQRRLDDLLSDICAEYEARHPDRVMWPAGMGQKMLTNPFLVDDEHPMEFDDSVYAVECFEREVLHESERRRKRAARPQLEGVEALVERLDAIEASLSGLVEALGAEGVHAAALLVSQASASVGFLREQAEALARLGGVGDGQK